MEGGGADDVLVRMTVRAVADAGDGALGIGCVVFDPPMVVVAAAAGGGPINSSHGSSIVMLYIVISRYLSCNKEGGTMMNYIGKWYCSYGAIRKRVLLKTARRSHDLQPQSDGMDYLLQVPLHHPIHVGI